MMKYEYQVFCNNNINNNNNNSVKLFTYDNKLHALSPRASYTDRATAASRRSVANLCG
jgi:hypothetical protein